MNVRVWLVVLLLSSFVIACGDPSCEDLGKHMAKLGNNAGRKFDDGRLKRLVADCKKSKMPASQIACMIATDDPAEMMVKCAPKEFERSTKNHARYMAKSKAAGATTNLRKLSLGAKAYYAEDHMSGGIGTGTSHSFPIGDTGPVPPKGACCKNLGEGCVANAGLWANPIWQALLFSVDSRDYYSYRYESKDGQSFKVYAYGDLDCDGIYSTFSTGGDGQGTELPISSHLPVE